MVHALTLRTLSTSSLAAQRQGRCTGAHRRGAVAAARGAGAADFSPEELQAAMSKQLKVSAEQAAARVAAKAKAAAAAAPEPAADQASELAQQRRAAREQQAKAARLQSQAAQNELAGRAAAMGGEELAAALHHQLRQSSLEQEAGPPAAAAGDADIGSTSGSKRDRLAPAAAYEDGSLLYTSDILSAWSVEDVLTA